MWRRVEVISRSAKIVLHARQRSGDLQKLKWILGSSYYRSRNPRDECYNLTKFYKILRTIGDIRWFRRVFINFFDALPRAYYTHEISKRFTARQNILFSTEQHTFDRCVLLRNRLLCNRVSLSQYIETTYILIQQNWCFIYIVCV